MFVPRFEVRSRSQRTRRQHKGGHWRANERRSDDAGDATSKKLYERMTKRNKQLLLGSDTVFKAVNQLMHLRDNVLHEEGAAEQAAVDGLNCADLPVQDYKEADAEARLKHAPFATLDSQELAVLKEIDKRPVAGNSAGVWGSQLALTLIGAGNCAPSTNVCLDNIELSCPSAGSSCVSSVACPIAYHWTRSELEESNPQAFQGFTMPVPCWAPSGGHIECCLARVSSLSCGADRLQCEFVVHSNFRPLDHATCCLWKQNEATLANDRAILVEGRVDPGSLNAGATANLRLVYGVAAGATAHGRDNFNFTPLKTLCKAALNTFTGPLSKMWIEENELQTSNDAGQCGCARICAPALMCVRVNVCDSWGPAVLVGVCMRMFMSICVLDVCMLRMHTPQFLLT